DGARENATKMGFKIAYDRSYPPNTVDFAPIVRGIQASNPDFVYIASYPTETVGIARAANEIGLKTKLFDGRMVGLQICIHQDPARRIAQSDRRLRLLRSRAH